MISTTANALGRRVGCVEIPPTKLLSKRKRTNEDATAILYVGYVPTLHYLLKISFYYCSQV